MKIVLVGDVMLGRLVNQELKSSLPEFPWGDTLSLFQHADCSICNLECVISDRGSPWSDTPKTFHFQSDSKNLAVLTAAGISAVSLANNHALDYGTDAALDMVRSLDSAEIHQAGAGADSIAASSPAIFERAGLRIGLIAFTDNEPAWEAQTNRPGVFYVPIDVTDERARKLFTLIEQTRAACDFLIVSAHWGPNWDYTPPPEHPAFAHAMIDAGASLIYGHSAHICRGIEVYRGSPILYSAGDFIDDYAVDDVERNDQSFIFACTVEKDHVTQLQLYPTIILDFHAQMAKGWQAEQIAMPMIDLCAPFNTQAHWDPDGFCLRIKDVVASLAV